MTQLPVPPFPLIFYDRSRCLFILTTVIQDLVIIIKGYKYCLRFLCLKCIIFVFSAFMSISFSQHHSVVLSISFCRFLGSEAQYHLHRPGMIGRCQAVFSTREAEQIFFNLVDKLPTLVRDDNVGAPKPTKQQTDIQYTLSSTNAWLSKTFSIFTCRIAHK